MISGEQMGESPYPQKTNKTTILSYLKEDKICDKNI
jgi:hypothetical protein